MTNQNSNPIGMEIGQYRIVAPLGGGGMATVYRAHQISMERDVAIKIIKPELAIIKDFTARFGREAKMLASLSHANILKIFDYGQHQDMWYLVMELLSGGSLADKISQAPLPLSLTMRMFEQIASALDYAHQRGIVHRDLKPQNVLLDDASNALLTDFGLARLVNSNSGLTMSGAAVGTPSYMAPEQWSSGAVDLRADVYSLGVMLFEMLSGALPFDGDTPFRLMHMHVYESPRSLQELKPDTSPDIEFVIAKALAKLPDDRFQSAGEMSNALRKAVTGVTSSFVSDRPSIKAPVSSRSVSAPVDKITLIPYDEQTADQAPPKSKGSANSALNLDHITLLPIDEPQAPTMPPPAVSIPAPFVDTDYVPKRQPSPEAQRKADRKAQQQRNMNLLTLATVVVAVVVVGLFAILLTQRNNSQAALPTTAPTAKAAVAQNNSPSVIIQTFTPAPTETTTITYTPSSTATRRPTLTKMPTSTVRPTSTRRAAPQATAPSSSGAGSITGTLLTDTELHAGPGSAHPVLFTAHAGEQFPIEGKTTDRDVEWFEITLQGGAPAWIIASAVRVEPGTFIPVVTPRPPPPPR